MLRHVCDVLESRRVYIAYNTNASKKNSLQYVWVSRLHHGLFHKNIGLWHFLPQTGIVTRKRAEGVLFVGNPETV